MRQDFRSHASVKALALLLAVVCGVGTILSGLYSAYHWDSLFDTDTYTSSSLWNQVMNEKYSYLMCLLDAYDNMRQGEESGYLEQKNYEAITKALSPEVTNFRYIIRDNATGEILLSSAGDSSLEHVSDLWSSLRTFSSEDTYYTDWEYLGSQDLTIFYDENGNSFAQFPGNVRLVYEQEKSHQYAVEYGVDDRLAVQDEFVTARNSFAKGDIRVLYLAIGCAVGFLVFTVFLMCCAGRRREADTFVLNWSDKIPYDLYLFAMLCAGVFAVGCGAELVTRSYWYRYSEGDFILATGAGILFFTAAFAIFEAGLMSTASRIKCHTLLRNTITWKVLAWCGRLLRRFWRDLCAALAGLPITYRTIFFFLGYLVLNAFLAAGLFRSYETGLYFLCLLGVNTVVLALMCRYTLQWERVRRGAQAIVSGQPDTVIDTGNMNWFPSLREHAAALNDLGGAINTAVEERLKSERMKAELITNVSHDLKTPLTSIINYVDLLKKEDIPGEKAQEYIEVLDRKSQRLKKLTEDLVEASKASTGTLTVNPERLGMGQLVDQALGEYSAKFEEAGLTLVSSLPEAEAYVTADGRHLWRIIDNLLGNCVKYALPGTRVYLDMTVWDGWVTLSLKNISAQQLNIPAEQLMERFVRGDESRTTEGSGLGLSIARSLTELQGGRFRLDVDGDLFKAVVSLPQA